MKEGSSDYQHKPLSSNIVDLGLSSGKPPDPSGLKSLMGLSEIEELMGIEKEEVTSMAETPLEHLECRQHAETQ